MLWMVPLMALGALMESATIPGFLASGIRPDFVVAVTVARATLRGWREGFLAGWIGGLFVDAVSAAPFGVNVVRLSLIGLLAGLAMQRLARTSPLLPIAAAGVASIGATLLEVLALQASRWAVYWSPALAGESVARALLTAGLMALALPALRVLEERTTSALDERRA